ncbi:hypothetical protein MPPM_3858 [Methylorubrum populi]|uniref:DUF6894 domain-containing protein n=1 Tax=Methylorubrum populi TaxID=223967 RepID=A0A160PJ05_9HYPH|nr:hypothetical protein [Methylorubrum populi]BAU92463.1 hypothetical protein MPPM_3858 [Methylorubrum populi]
MPRFYIDTHDHISVVDEDGYDLPNEAAVRALVQRSLVGMAAEAALARSASRIRADVRDETGQRVMSATVSVAIEWAEEAGDGNGVLE